VRCPVIDWISMRASRSSFFTFSFFARRLGQPDEWLAHSSLMYVGA